MDYLGKGEMLTNKVITEFERNKNFVHIEHFWDLLFQLMKHGTNTLRVAFKFLFSTYKVVFDKLKCPFHEVGVITCSNT